MIYIKRIFLIVLDSFGIGEMPDADRFGDEGSNTLKTLFDSKKLNVPNMAKLGLFGIGGNSYSKSSNEIIGSYARMREQSNGKDTTVGHWEIAGLVSEKPFPTYPNGFPNEIIDEFEKRTGRKVICNKPYSGTQVILDYGKQHEESGDLIVYTSADSVFQIAANEDIIPLEKLYEYCELAREILVGEHAVGRVIARPFVGNFPNYTRTPNRHDYSVCPPKDTALDYLKNNGFDVISVGKIFDIFSGKGITESHPTKSNVDGMETTERLMNKDFNGLCFVNLVEFDSLYGHRNDIDGYTKAINEFDAWLPKIVNNLNDDDMLIITADHGCDPKTPSTDHSREYTPMLVYGNKIRSINLGTRNSFADIGKSILDVFGIENKLSGESFYAQIKE